MVDTDTFLTTLYAMVDDFCKIFLPTEGHAGPPAALSHSEVVTLAIYGQWQGFGSERGFYRYAQRHLRAAFPQLPTREQFNRQVRQHYAALVAFFCISSTSWWPSAASMKPWTARGCRPGMPSTGGQGGCRGWPILAGAIGWAGMRASIYCWRSTPSGSSRALALGLPAPKINPWRRRSLPSVVTPPGPGERGRPGLWAVCCRQGLRRASPPADLVEGLWRPRHLSAEAQ